jgi:hypothetical protein
MTQGEQILAAYCSNHKANRSVLGELHNLDANQNPLQGCPFRVIRGVRAKAAGKSECFHDLIAIGVAFFSVYCLTLGGLKSSPLGDGINFRHGCQRRLQRIRIENYVTEE